jgi:NifU-like protein involved in Fe-S cluster formation
MSGDLYQDRLLELAAAATGAGRLEDPDVTVRLDNPMCGDRITLDVKLADGKVAEVAHETRACLLCQAAASVIGAHAIGLDAAHLAEIRAGVEALLRDGESETLAWHDLDAFAPVHGHPSRYSCVLLPLDALAQAFEEIGAS